MEAHVIVHSVFCFTLLCVCVLHSVSARRGILLCFTPPDFSGVPRLVWGTQFFHCLPSTVYPLSPLLTLPLFFSMKRGPAAVSLLPKTIFLQVRLLFSTWYFFFLSVKRHCLQGCCLGGVQGVLRRVWGAESTPRHQRVKERWVWARLSHFHFSTTMLGTCHFCHLALYHF